MQSASSADNTKMSANSATTDIKKHSDDRQDTLASQQAAQKEWLERYQAAVEKLSENLTRQRLLRAANRFARGQICSVLSEGLARCSRAQTTTAFSGRASGIPS